MYNYHTLSNGIRIVFKQNNSPVTHTGVYVNVGSRDEEPRNYGIAHFIEHTVFKGTTHRKAHHILNRIDGVGGELNAFTTKEETCIYTSSLHIHLPRCLELLSDILFNPTFPQQELDKEKSIVIEEIKSYKDTPSELIFDEFEQYFFDSHPLAHNILGTPRTVRSFDSETVKKFFAEKYTPERMVISIVGSNKFEQVVRLCEKYFNFGPIGPVPCAPKNLKPSNPQTFKPFSQTLSRHTHQMHVMVGCPAPSIYDDEKTAFSLLNNIIGGPAMNSRLNVAIREKNGFCYTIESQYTPFSDAGIFYIYAGIDAGQLDRFLKLLNVQLEQLRSKPLTTTQLRAAQQQYVAQFAINTDLALNEMQSIGKALLAYDRVDTLDDISRDIRNVTASRLQEIATELLHPDNFSLLVYR